jgi:hypothetical protein
MANRNQTAICPVMGYGDTSVPRTNSLWPGVAFEEKQVSKTKSKKAGKLSSDKTIGSAHGPDTMRPTREVDCTFYIQQDIADELKRVSRATGKSYGRIVDEAMRWFIKNQGVA